MKHPIMLLFIIILAGCIHNVEPCTDTWPCPSRNSPPARSVYWRVLHPHRVLVFVANPDGTINRTVWADERDLPVLKPPSRPRLWRRALRAAHLQWLIVER